MLVLTFASYSRRLIKPVVHRTFTEGANQLCNEAKPIRKTQVSSAYVIWWMGKFKWADYRKCALIWVESNTFFKIIIEFLSEEYHYSSSLRRHCRNTTKLFFVSGLRTRRHTWRHFKKKRPRDSKLFDRHHRQMHGNKTKNSNFQKAH